MLFFTPRYIKEAKQYLHGAKKFLNYKRDLLTADQLSAIDARMLALKSAMKDKRCEPAQDAMRELDLLLGKIEPPKKDAAWRENVEVFLVAIVIAAGIKAFFVQPFRIPTGSMQPTLYGIVATPTNEPPPNPLVRAFEFVWLGRTYLNVVATEDDVVDGLKERTYANFFTFTDIICRKNTYTVFAPAEPIARGFRLLPGVPIHAGQAIVRGHVDTGDQVFVDKVSYNFVKPSLGDVFVFKTTGISRIEAGLDPAMGSQHYIKRLAGLPGQTLRISPPNLYINGSIPQLPVFLRVMGMKDGYRGYSNAPAGGPGFMILGSPEATFTVPSASYFALGDNSYHSRDSRDWGIVPERNVAGRGFFVYWPFSSRWGLIH